VPVAILWGASALHTCSGGKIERVSWWGSVRCGAECITLCRLCNFVRFWLFLGQDPLKEMIK
jgi:hypothetical protein